MTTFWDIAPYSVIEVDRRFRGAFCRHHQDDENSCTDIGIGRTM
jgi:hypothetical protein